MFIESLLKKSTQITQSRNAKTLTPSHMKQCILSESRFDFLKGKTTLFIIIALNLPKYCYRLGEKYSGCQCTRG